jgi:hypothetical protein
VEIELGFDGERTVEHVHMLSRHMERDLAEQVPGLRFRIVPVWGPEEAAAPGGPACRAAAAVSTETAAEVKVSGAEPALRR